MKIEKSNMYMETLEVSGVYPAMMGMRNPMDSWALCDTSVAGAIGSNDLKLAQKLAKAGPEHAKYLRQIQVWADMKMPRYWWSEADTYKFGTSNSCSTMHKLLTSGKITRADFVQHDDLFTIEIYDDIIEMLNECVSAYNDDGTEYSNGMNKSDIIPCAKAILPEGYLQLRTRNTNYAELMNMYHQRKNHRLKREWQDVFCRWCETLPYFKELCIDTVV